MADVLSFDKIFYTNFEPKLQNRFIMEIDGIPSFMVKSANRPKIESEVVELDHINLKRKIKGKSNLLHFFSFMLELLLQLHPKKYL